MNDSYFLSAAKVDVYTSKYEFFFIFVQKTFFVIFMVSVTTIHTCILMHGARGKCRFPGRWLEFSLSVQAGVIRESYSLKTQSEVVYYLFFI